VGAHAFVLLKDFLTSGLERKKYGRLNISYKTLMPAGEFGGDSTLLCEVTIHSICKCFVCFFYPHLRIKSKTSAYIRHLL
jgi:hypothetical protein